jgi:hypothetical protein
MIKMIKTILGACFYVLIIASFLCILTYLVQDLVLYYTSPVEGTLPILIRISNSILSFPIIGTLIGSVINLLQQL